MIKHQARPTKNHDYVIVKTAKSKMVFNCTMKEYNKGMTAHQSGKSMQDSFPFLTADEREFLLTGLTFEDWATLPEEN